MRPQLCLAACLVVMPIIVLARLPMEFVIRSATILLVGMMEATVEQLLDLLALRDMMLIIAQLWLEMAFAIL